MIAYHGTTIFKINKLIDAIENDILRFPGLFVTDTPWRAVRYANTQATGNIDLTAELKPHGAILTLEIPDDTYWMTRPQNHNTLDAVEACIDKARVVAIEQKMCNYLFCSCHGNHQEYSTTQAAERLGLSSQRIRCLCLNGRIGRKIGNRWIINHDELMALARHLRHDLRSPLHS